jgi:hypothetical protein
MVACRRVVKIFNALAARLRRLIHKYVSARARLVDWLVPVLGTGCRGCFSRPLKVQEGELAGWAADPKGPVPLQQVERRSIKYNFPSLFCVALRARRRRLVINVIEKNRPKEQRVGSPLPLDAHYNHAPRPPWHSSAEHGADRCTTS